MASRIARRANHTLISFICMLATTLVGAQDLSLTPTMPGLAATPTPFTAAASARAAAEATINAISMIEPVEHHVLQRPIEIAVDNVHWVDRTYPYGSTQWNLRPVHLGVEFVNPRGTPVMAAAAGKVVFAGSDREILIGPQKDYYGEVVLLAHEFRSLDNQTLFTLYAHLDKIDVQVGREVQAGDSLGRVGSTGVALGAHLHFEVRVEDPWNYLNTRNPELWLQNYVDHGMIAGFIHNGKGDAIYAKRLAIRSEDVNREIYTYGSERVNRDPVWGENFTVGDLPAGEYEIVVLKESGSIGYRGTVTVSAYQTSFVDILISEYQDQSSPQS